MMRLVIILVAALIMTSCVSSSGSNSSHVVTIFVNGDWNLSSMTAYPKIWNGMGYDSKQLSVNSTEITLVGDAISGSAIVGASSTLSGWTVGESVTIRGAVVGTMWHLRLTNGSGAKLEMILGLYDDFNVLNGDNRLTEIYEMTGVSIADGDPRSVGGTSMSSTITRTGAATRSPGPAVTVTIADAPVAVADGFTILTGVQLDVAQISGGACGLTSITTTDVRIRIEAGVLTTDSAGMITAFSSNDPADASAIAVSETLSLNGTIDGRVLQGTLSASGGWSGSVIGYFGVDADGKPNATLELLIEDKALGWIPVLENMKATWDIALFAPVAN